MLSWGFCGFLDIVFVDDVSNERLCPVLLVCLTKVEVVWVFLPSCCEDTVAGVDGCVVFLCLAVVPCAFDVPAAVEERGAAFDRG